ncbi:MAG: amino acid ABC transporter substrate-binding protein [Gammaproteobacteria bacterium]|nr:MAG: amino acid ABC transporter substrate-binding protein [Gammaproteobacteria bacterium]
MAVVWRAGNGGGTLSINRLPRRVGGVLLAITLSLAMPLYAKPMLNLVTFLERPLVDVELNKPEGLLVALIDTLMSRAEVDYTIRIVPAKRSLLIAKRGRNHCVFPIERSQEREVFFKWVSPVLISRYGLYARAGKQIVLTTLNEARPYVLGSYLGSGVGEYLASFGFNVHYAHRNELNADMLMRNRIDFWVSDTISARFLAKERSQPLVDPAIVFYTSVRAMGCNLGVSDELIEALQQALLAMYRDKTVARIYQRYDATLLK